MRMYDLLKQNQKIVKEKWFDQISKTYAERTSQFLTSVEDPFANPVGTTFAANLSDIYDLLVKKADSTEFRKPIEDVVRIRAVQEFSASKAVGWIFLIKPVLRELWHGKLYKDAVDYSKSPGALEDLAEFESQIDGLALICFDLYMECREKDYMIKATELRDRSKKFMERVRVMEESRAGQPESDE